MVGGFKVHLRHSHELRQKMKRKTVAQDSFFFVCAEGLKWIAAIPEQTTGEIELT